MKSRIFVFAIVSLFAAPTLGLATIYESDNFSGDSSFNNESNWFPFPGGPPGFGDAAIFLFDLPSDTVNVASGTLLDSLVVRSDAIVDLNIAGTFDIDIPTSPAVSLLIGALIGDDSTLNLQSGTLVTKDSLIGYDSGSSGNMSMSNATWLPNNVYLAFFDGSAGSLEIQSGGSATVLGDRQMRIYPNSYCRSCVDIVKEDS